MSGLGNFFVIVATSLTVCAPLGGRAVTFAELFGAPVASEVIAYGAEAKQTMVRFAPADLKAGEARPAIVLIHGGAWVAGDAEIFYPHARYFASRGLVAFSINYRLNVFLASLGFLKGEPTLEVATPPAWEVPVKKKP